MALQLMRSKDRNLFLEDRIDADIRIRTIVPSQRDLLIRMYDRFDPLGAAFGLPPYKTEARREFIGRAVNHRVNLAAFSAA